MTCGRIVAMGSCSGAIVALDCCAQDTTLPLVQWVIPPFEEPRAATIGAFVAITFEALGSTGTPTVPEILVEWLVFPNLNFWPPSSSGQPPVCGTTLTPGSSSTENANNARGLGSFRSNQPGGSGGGAVDDLLC